MYANTKGLPDEIVIQILLRLSVKSLLRFKTMCKSWHLLFDSTSFIKRHLNLLDSTNTNDYHLVRQNITTIDSTLPFGLLSTVTKQIIDVEDTPCPYPGKQHEFNYMWGPVNGIYCITIEYESSREIFLLWNPGQRQFHVLPPCPIEESCTYTSTGFGYDSSNNDYKVIIIHELSMYSTYFHLYSLSTNTWKQLNLLQIVDHTFGKGKRSNGDNELHWDVYVSGLDGVYLNGSCHWVSGGVCILSFNMEKEVFGLTPEPKMIFQGWGISMLTIVNGCLAVICVIEPQGIAISQMMSRVFDVCLMREYGKEESWTRAYTITLTSSSPGKFLGIVGYEFFVLEEEEAGENKNENRRSKLVSYSLTSPHDEARNEYCCVQWPIKDYEGRRVFPYRESIVSIKPTNVRKINN